MYHLVAWSKTVQKDGPINFDVNTLKFKVFFEKVKVSKSIHSAEQHFGWIKQFSTFLLLENLSINSDETKIQSVNSKDLFT